MVADVSCGRKKKKLIDEREELIVAILSPTRSWVGTEGWDAFVHGSVVVEVAEEAMEREGKERRLWWKQNWGGLIFFADFGLDFLPQSMKSTPIYKGWKMDVLSLLLSNLGPWFNLKGSQPLVQSGYHRLSDLL